MSHQIVMFFKIKTCGSGGRVRGVTCSWETMTMQTDEQKQYPPEQRHSMRIARSHVHFAHWLSDLANCNIVCLHHLFGHFIVQDQTIMQSFVIKYNQNIL
jgi:hypothetical protein